jgi:hypothetical protein
VVVVMGDISLGLAVTVAWLWAMVLEGRARQVPCWGLVLASPPVSLTAGALAADTAVR